MIEEYFGLENEADKKSQQSEQVARSFTECPEDCPWMGRCLNGTKFDDGKGGCKPGEKVKWLNVSYFSPCFLIQSKPIIGDNTTE